MQTDTIWFPPEPRLPEARGLVEGGYYFVVHAPRQSGKTATLAAIANSLRAESDYVALRFSCEAGGAMGDDYAAVGRTYQNTNRAPVVRGTAAVTASTVRHRG